MLVPDSTMRIALYNSASRGTGQYVRSLKIANLITSHDPRSTCTILAGNGIVDRVLPYNTNVVQLPQIWKSTKGILELRSSAPSQKQASPDSVVEALAERRRIIRDVIDSIMPDVFIVDSRPTGLSDEVVAPLQLAGSFGTRRLLIYRDIVDSPSLTVQRWREEMTYQVMEELYDGIGFLGEDYIFDAVDNYGLDTIRHKVRHLGFLGAINPASSSLDTPTATNKINVLVTVGGGYDGKAIIEAMVDLITSKCATYDNFVVTIALGARSPLVPEDLRCRLDRARADVKVLRHIVDLSAEICLADVVVSMCGYNSLFELVEAGKKVIAVPRSHSGCEQIIRAGLIRGIYDGIWIVPQDEICASRLAEALDVALAAPSPKKNVPMNGAANLEWYLLRNDAQRDCAQFPR